MSDNEENTFFKKFLENDFKTCIYTYTLNNILEVNFHINSSICIYSQVMWNCVLIKKKSVT